MHTIYKHILSTKHSLLKSHVHLYIVHLTMTSIYVHVHVYICLLVDTTCTSSYLQYMNTSIHMFSCIYMYKTYMYACTVYTLPAWFPSEFLRMLSGYITTFLQCLHHIVLGEVHCYEAILNQLMDVIETLFTYTCITIEKTLKFHHNMFNVQIQSTVVKVMCNVCVCVVALYVVHSPTQ